MAQSLHIFEVLAKQHEAMLLAYVHSLVPDTKLAEDVAQQTFLIAYRKIDLLQDPEAFPAWLRGIARLEALTILRRQRREVLVEPAVLEQLDEAYRAFEQQSACATWDERTQMVKECYERLPETLRSVCHLHYFEDHKAREIGDMLEVNLNSILKRLQRARAAIRDCVQRRLAGEGLTEP